MFKTMNEMNIKMNTGGGAKGMKFQSVERNDDLMLREGGKYTVWTETIHNKTYEFIVNESRVRVPLKNLTQYIESGKLQIIEQ